MRINLSFHLHLQPDLRAHRPHHQKRWPPHKYLDGRGGKLDLAPRPVVVQFIHSQRTQRTRGGTVAAAAAADPGSAAGAVY